MGLSLVQINDWREKDIDPKVTFLFKAHGINNDKITGIS